MNAQRYDYHHNEPHIKEPELVLGGEYLDHMKDLYTQIGSLTEHASLPAGPIQSHTQRAIDTEIHGCVHA